MSMMIEIAGHAMMITGFVFAMMLLIEYLNVRSHGAWDRRISRMTHGQSLISALLGATPGCLGAFAVGSLYMHRILTFGALTAAMIATCGDEAFVMLALFPGKALVIFAVLFVVGVGTGIAIDTVLKRRRTSATAHLQTYAAAHMDVEECTRCSRAMVIGQWKKCSPQRGILTFVLVLFILGVAGGALGHHHLGVDPRDPHATEHLEDEHAADAGDTRGEWGWVRITLLAAGLVGLFIVVTVPDHFLDEHLWNHIAKVHIWRIFLWTLGALLLTHFLVERVDIEAAVSSHHIPVLLTACLVGIIPQSGPHLVFVTLYAQGAVPFSILLASCIVQDGHGMMPILAHSRTAFLTVKAINFAVGLAVGLAGALMGW